MNRITRPNEPAGYRDARDKLLAAEIELKEHRERVAELRRSLPHGAEIDEEYVFDEGFVDDGREIEKRRLDELFDGDKASLILYHFMYGPDWDKPCPMCTMWTEGYDAVAPYVSQRAGFAIVAHAPIDKLVELARARGWNNLRLLSSHGTSFNEDMFVTLGEDEYPAASVFSRDPESGTIHHRYTTEGSIANFHHRALDLLTPVWNLLDLLPEGRGDFFPSLDV
jgi:predicted dithiol-disulfide oxidoreductase (DUF899 family)